MESIGWIENSLFGKELLMLPARKNHSLIMQQVFCALFVRRLRFLLVNKTFANDATMFSAHYFSALTLPARIPNFFL